MSHSFQSEKDKRRHPRYRLRWPATLIINPAGENLVVEGRLHDLSIGGASLLCDLNIRTHDRVTLILRPPALTAGEAPQIVTVHSNLVYTVHSSEHMCFRLGLQFVRFEMPGRHWLENRLVHHAPVYEKSPA